MKLVINAKDALADIDMYLKNRIENLRKQKVECDNIFNKFMKDVGGKDVSNLPKITNLFISYINQIKTLYIKTLNEFIKISNNLNIHNDTIKEKRSLADISNNNKKEKEEEVVDGSEDYMI